MWGVGLAQKPHIQTSLHVNNEYLVTNFHNCFVLQLSAVEADKLRLAAEKSDLDQKIAGLENDIEEKQEVIDQHQADKVLLSLN